MRKQDLSAAETAGIYAHLRTELIKISKPIPTNDLGMEA